METPRLHVREIDVLKGFCVLCVAAIHAAFLADTAIFRFLIDRAVLVFLVLFGVTSEFWWRRSREESGATRRWYVSRLKRVVPTYWAMMICWWLIVALWHRPEGDLILGWPQVVITFLGSAPWVGTTWFVTIILQFILLMPVLRRVPSGLWSVPVLGVAALSTWAAAAFMLEVITAGKLMFGDNVSDMYYYWAVFPRALWHVTAGIFIARWWQARVGLVAMGVALAVTVAGAVYLTLERPVFWDDEARLQQVAVLHLLDVPLAIALLGLSRWLPLPGIVQRALAWCGRWSWGIYLAHLLLHEVARIAGFDPTLYPHFVRAIYALLLLGFGTLLAVVVQRATRGLAAVFPSARRIAEVG
jgi:peptidoglycan/LPS O-acetylase OafA/YrhL